MFDRSLEWCWPHLEENRIPRNSTISRVPGKTRWRIFHGVQPFYFHISRGHYMHNRATVHHKWKGCERLWDVNQGNKNQGEKIYFKLLRIRWLKALEGHRMLPFRMCSHYLSTKINSFRLFACATLLKLSQKLQKSKKKLILLIRFFFFKRFNFFAGYCISFPLKRIDVLCSSF